MTSLSSLKLKMQFFRTVKKASLGALPSQMPAFFPAPNPPFACVFWGVVFVILRGVCSKSHPLFCFELRQSFIDLELVQ